MKQSIFLSVLIVLTSTNILASEILDRFILEMHKSADDKSTNCFANCNAIMLAATANKVGLHPSLQTYSDATILKVLAKRQISAPEDELRAKLQMANTLVKNTGIVHHVIPLSIFSSDAFPGLQLTRVAMHLPDLVQEEDDTHINLKPLRHCFLIASDKSDASICHSWEKVMSFQCSKPFALSVLESQMLDLQARVDDYVSAPTQDTYSLVLEWFLDDAVAQPEKVVLKREQYDGLVTSSSVKFFENRNDSLFFHEYFSYAESQSHDELTREISLATFAGKAVFAVATLQAPHWQLVSDNDL